MVTVALFGAGFIGTVHAENIARHRRARLRYVSDVRRDAATELAYRHEARVADQDEIFADEDVDAVLIACSTHTHADLLMRTIAAGKPAYCEKPIDLDIARVKAVWTAARERPVPIFCRLQSPLRSQPRTPPHEGDIGRIEMMHLTSRGPTPPPVSYIEMSGGQFRDQTIHFFDLACWITGQAPVEAYAVGECLVDPAIGEAGDIDTSMVILRMQSGALCHIDCSRRTTYGYDERIEVFGSEGMVESQRLRTTDVHLYKGQSIVSNGLHSGWFERIEPSFATALDAFIVAVEEGGSASPSLEDGVRAQLISEAAVRSLHEGRPVKVEYWGTEA